MNALYSGEIDCDDFKAKFLCHKDKPAIVNVNIGTTVKGAVDDLDLVIEKLEEAGKDIAKLIGSFISCKAISSSSSLSQI